MLRPPEKSNTLAHSITYGTQSFLTIMLYMKCKNLMKSGIMVWVVPSLKNIKTLTFSISDTLKLDHV